MTGVVSRPVPKLESIAEAAPTSRYDVIVIGGGPAGASAAIYTARARLTTLVLDRGLTAGALGSAEKISNYPGVPGPISGTELIAIMRRQAESFGAKFVMDRVTELKTVGETKSILGSGGTYEARAIILATGSLGRSVALAGEDRLRGKGVSYSATSDGAFFQNRNVAVVGNSDEALEEARLLGRFADRVHVLVQTSQLKAPRELIDAVELASNIDLRFGVTVTEILGQEQVEGLRFSTRDGNVVQLPVNGVFLYLQGNRPTTDFLQGQLDSRSNGCLRVDEQQATSSPGVFAVGDVLHTHVRQAIVAAADGVTAAISVERYLNRHNAPRQDWG